MKEIYGKIQECMNLPGISFQKLKRKLKKIITNLDENIHITQSSTNLLNFYVNDLLDFAQINGGLFRQDC